MCVGGGRGVRSEPGHHDCPLNSGSHAVMIK